MKILVTDKPDPKCSRCRGKGVIGGCNSSPCTHLHTMSFCECVNERYEANFAAMVADVAEGLFVEGREPE